MVLQVLDFFQALLQRPKIRLTLIFLICYLVFSAIKQPCPAAELGRRTDEGSAAKVPKTRWLSTRSAKVTCLNRKRSFTPANTFAARSARAAIYPVRAWRIFSWTALKPPLDMSSTTSGLRLLRHARGDVYSDLNGA